MFTKNLIRFFEKNSKIIFIIYKMADFVWKFKIKIRKETKNFK